MHIIYYALYEDVLRNGLHARWLNFMCSICLDLEVFCCDTGRVGGVSVSFY